MRVCISYKSPCSLGKSLNFSVKGVNQTDDGNTPLRKILSNGRAAGREEINRRFAAKKTVDMSLQTRIEGAAKNVTSSENSHAI